MFNTHLKEHKDTAKSRIYTLEVWVLLVRWKQIIPIGPTDVLTAQDLG